MIINTEIQIALGPPGVPGNVLEIKKVCDKIIIVGKELLNWEYKVNSSLLPEELRKVRDYMSGWSKPIFRFLYEFPNEVRRVIQEDSEGKNNIRGIYIKIDPMAHVEEIVDLIKEYYIKNL